jgi:hypothetical protein
MIFLLSVTLLTVSANAAIFKGARATPRSEDISALLDGWTPRPTPRAELPHNLKKRTAQTGEQLGFYVTDNTCGYLHGSLGMLDSTASSAEADFASGASMTCRSPSSCFAVTVSGGGGVVGCADDTTARAVTDCVNSVQYFSGTLCDNTCHNDNLVLKW